MIGETRLTNKLLVDMNTNFNNLSNVIRSSIEATSIKEVNKEIDLLDRNLYRLDKGGIGIDPLKYMNAYDKNKQLEEMKAKLEQNKSKINEVTSATKQASTELEKMSNLKTSNLNQELDKTDKKIKQITNTSNKSNFGQSLRTALGIGTVALGIRKAVGFFKEANTEAVDYAETVNLFNVAMGKKTDQYGNLDREASKYYTKAIAFQEKLSEKLGINIEESMNYQALFNSMAKSMSISDKYASLMSENLTKLGYDLSSLFNINTEEAMRKLKAGLAGETEPLRAIGLDVTEQTIKQELDRLGIDRSVRNMSQAEKSILRYISVLRQASLAHGDFAKTMDSPANQLRIFNAQLTAFKRNMGSLWQGLLGNILPYVNAIMMVINELLKMVAKLFGYEVWEQDVSISTNIGADDLADDLGTATQKAKEFKKQLMGFDEINNITLPDKTSGGSGGGASVGGIDQRLLDVMKEYDNMMDRVSNKATEIRDKMMAWLGFERDDNGTWKLKEGYTNIEKILDIAKAIGTALVTWNIMNFVKKIKDAVKDMTKLKDLKKELGVISIAVSLVSSVDTINKLADGEITSETIVKSILESLGFTVGLGAIGVSTPISIPLSITLLVIKALAALDSKLGIDKKMWEPLYKAFGFEYSNDVSIANWTTRFKIMFKAVDLAIKEDAIGKLREKLFNKIGEVFTDFGNWVKTKWGDFTNWISTIPNKLGYYAGEVTASVYLFFTKTIPQAWDGFISWLSNKWNDFTSWLSSLPNKIWQDLCNIGNEVEKFFIETIPQAWNSFINWIKTLPEKFVQFGKDIIQGLINGVQNAWSGFWKVITDFIDGFVQGFKDKLGIHSPSTIFEEFGVNIILGLKQGIQNKIEEIRNKIFEVAGNIKKWFSSKISNINEKGTEIITRIKTGISNSELILSNKIGEVAGNVKRWFSGSLGNLSSIGYNIISGISSGINSAKSNLMKTVQRLANSIPDWAKKILHIESPSKVMRDMVGKFIPLGIAEGIDNNANSVFKSIKDLNDEMSKEFKINPNDFKIDTNQFIDYGQISGAIATQSNVNVSSDIEGRIENAIYSAFSNVTIPVEIEATTDEGVIFKKVQVKAREFTMQTGEPAFDF